MYKSEQNKWKIVDFGLTASGTSSQVYRTIYSRGTSTYRAPELVNNCIYNNKVDIWAIGCILFEVLFSEKAFLCDFDVSQFALKIIHFNLQMKIPTVDEWDESLQTSITSLIKELLSVDPAERPTAKDLARRFYYIFKWAGLKGLSEEERIKYAARIEKTPKDWMMWNELTKLYKKKRDYDTAIEVYQAWRERIQPAKERPVALNNFTISLVSSKRPWNVMSLFKIPNGA